MTTSRVCIYRYDALDVLVDVETVGGEKRQRFYRREQLVTELERLSSQSVFQHGKPLLALQSRQGNELASALLTSDQQGSVLQVTESGGSVFQVYTPYGHRRVESGLGSLLGFAGEAVDPGTGRYLLGNGRRVFNPVLMRFNSPDRLSPFGRGGLNPYAYCLGDPVNFSDPSGEFAAIARILTSMGGLFQLGHLVEAGCSFSGSAGCTGERRGVSIAPEAFRGCRVCRCCWSYRCCRGCAWVGKHGCRCRQSSLYPAGTRGQHCAGVGGWFRGREIGFLVGGT